MCYPCVMNRRLFGERLAVARRRAGLTQRQLASALDEREMNISRWERGANVPTLDKTANCARALGVSIEWLIGAEASS